MSDLAHQGAAWGTWPNRPCHQSLSGCQGLAGSVGMEGSGALEQHEEDGSGDSGSRTAHPPVPSVGTGKLLFDGYFWLNSHLFQFKNSEK